MPSHWSQWYQFIARHRQDGNLFNFLIGFLFHVISFITNISGLIMCFWLRWILVSQIDTILWIIIIYIIIGSRFITWSLTVYIVIHLRQYFKFVFVKIVVLLYYNVIFIRYITDVTAHHWRVWSRNHCKDYRRDESKGWSWWVITICRYVGITGCCSEMQGTHSLFIFRFI